MMAFKTLDFGWWKPVLLWDKKPITVQFRCLESYSPRAGQGWPSRAPSLLSWEVRAGSPGKSWCSHVRIQRSKGFVERKLQRWRESLLTIQLNVPWRMHLRKAVLGKNHPKGLVVRLPAATTVREEYLLSLARLENCMTHKMFGWSTEEGLTLIGGQ